jgi:hypothetical protein
MLTPGCMTSGLRRFCLALGLERWSRELLAAAHESANRGHHLRGALILLAWLGSDHTGMSVAVEQPERHLVQGGLDRCDLCEDVDAVAIRLDHSLDAAHLTLDTP